MKRNEKLPEKAIIGIPSSHFAVIAYATALAVEGTAYLVGTQAAKMTCGGTVRSASAQYSVLLGLSGLIVAIIGLVIAFKHAKKLRSIGAVVLLLSLVLAVASQFIQVRICF